MPLPIRVQALTALQQPGAEHCRQLHVMKLDVMLDDAEQRLSSCCQPACQLSAGMKHVACNPGPPCWTSPAEVLAPQQRKRQLKLADSTRDEPKPGCAHLQSPAEAGACSRPGRGTFAGLCPRSRPPGLLKLPVAAGTLLHLANPPLPTRLAQCCEL